MSHECSRLSLILKTNAKNSDRVTAFTSFRCAVVAVNGATVVSPRRVLESWAALIGLSSSTYLALLEELSLELAAYAESLQWPLLLIGATGAVSVLHSSWKISSDPQWRRSHGLAGTLNRCGPVDERDC